MLAFCVNVPTCNCFRYTAERIAQWPEKDRAERLSKVQSYLTLHCPQAVWAIIEGLSEAQMSVLNTKKLTKRWV